MMEELDMSDLDALCIYAGRYAMGRGTYASSETANIVGRLSDRLSSNAKMVIARDVRMLMARIDKRAVGTSAWDMDIQPWADLAERLDG